MTTNRWNATTASSKSRIATALLGIATVTILMGASPVIFSARAASASQAPVVSHQNDLTTAQELIDGVVPDGAVKVPAKEIPAGLQIEAWRLHGHLYVVSAAPLTGVTSRPAEVFTNTSNGRSVAVFLSPVYFYEKRFILAP